MMRRIGRFGVAGMLAVASVTPAIAAEITVKMQKATQQGPGDTLGTITIAGSEAGAEFRLSLHGLPPGLHGFHVHENGECRPILVNGILIPAGAAGRHWDPGMTFKHVGPYGDGHLGDLPVIKAAPDGTATQTLTAPRIKDISRLHGLSLVIQTSGDTYSDQPLIAGGGGLALACGTIK
jgi:Cu-Zn family superoxide dismutase